MQACCAKHAFCLVHVLTLGKSQCRHKVQVGIKLKMTNFCLQKYVCVWRVQINT